MRLALLALTTLPLWTACADSGEEPELIDTALSGGALVKLDMTSRVGVMLDDIPAGPLREAAAQAALAKPVSFWTERAQRQIRLMYYRLVFRGAYYSSDHSHSSKVRGPLPLPDKAVWNVALKGTPRRDVSGGHDVIVTDYTFGTYIVTDRDSPGAVEPALATIGGSWDEAFNLPTDPDLLLERTGYACMDEEEYPLGSVFEENTWYFFDDSCKSGSTWCHLTQKPQESCTESLQKHTGIEKPSLHFSRVDYDTAIADQYRVGDVMKPAGADLAVVPAGMQDERRVVWRYFKPGSCEVEEGVIGKLGWRRLMMFSAIVQNNGTDAVHIGDLTDPNNPYLKTNVYEFSACHAHYHFSHYGNFLYNTAPGSKRAFCLEDTNRFHNDESTKLTAEHQSCNYQGIGPGWGDEYEFGIPGQWVDVTDVDTTTGSDLSFKSNPDGFMCEGTPARDANGNLIFEQTAFTAANGQPVYRIKCNTVPNWDANNFSSVMVTAPANGSFVTDACKNGEVGPNKNCGFSGGTMKSCQVGSTVTLSCKLGKSSAAQTLRVCEKSGEHNTGIPCTLAESISNSIISGATQVSFPCPVDRDTGLGGYSLYNSTVVSGTGSVSCTAL